MLWGLPAVFAASGAGLPGPDPNVAGPVTPSPCTADAGNTYEAATFAKEGWKGPAYSRYPGSCQRLHFAIGPIAVRPGQNDVLLQPLTYEKPAYDGYIVRFKPNLVRADGSVPPIEEIHLHHAVWFTAANAGGGGAGTSGSGGGQLASLDFRNYGNGPFFASGEEKTIFDSPRGYGFPVKASDEWNLLYMIHNQRAQPDTVWITYDIDYIAKTVGDQLGIRPAYPIWLDVRPSIYPVFNVERKYGKVDPTSYHVFCTFPKDTTADSDPWGQRIAGQGSPGNGAGTPWTFPARGQPLGRIPAFEGGTLIGVAGHLHPGGVSVNVDLKRGAQQQRIFTSEAHYWDWKNPKKEGGPATSWDVSMGAASLPQWGVHVQPGDTILMNATYDASIQDTYEDMGIAIAFIAPDGPSGPSAPGLDPFTAPKDPSEHCVSGGLAAKTPTLCDKGRVTHGHMAEASHHGGPNGTLPARLGSPTNQIAIAGFEYLPGDQSTLGSSGIPTVSLGTPLAFTNIDAAADVFHSITACAYPCRGATGIAFPLGNGTSSDGQKVSFDSGELGLEPAFGTTRVGPAKNETQWTLPVDAAHGFRAGQTYTYFCRIHPFMRGAFAVVGGGPGAGAPRAGPPGPAPPSSGGDWPSYGHDLSNTRNQGQEHLIGTLNAPLLSPAWTFSSTAAGGSGDFTGTPVVADGYLLAASNRGWIFAMNADTGQLVWKTKVPSGGINSSLTVVNGTVLAAVSNVSNRAGTGAASSGGPYMVALDEKTGAVRWRSAVLDGQAGADVYSSPVPFNGLVLEGVSGGAAELAAAPERSAFHGSVVILDQSTGAIVHRTWSIPPADWAKGFAGGGVWSTAAVDPASQVAYVGVGNPFQKDRAHPNTDSVVKLDLDRAHATFGQIIGVYHGDVDTYTDTSKLPCVTLPGNSPPYYPQGAGSCGQIDLDFGAAPNLLRINGRTLVGAGQKSGVYHEFDPVTMRRVSTTIVGPPTPSVGGIVGSTAFDGHSVYGPITVPGYVWSLTAGSGQARWISPVGDGLHWGEPVATANGVVYTVDLTGSLDAFDAATGLPLLHRPMMLGSGAGTNPTFSWGGVSVARHTVYASVGITSLSTGFIIAYRPGAGGGQGSGPPPPGPGSGAGLSPTVVAGPGAYATTYATPVMVVGAGGTVSFMNEDLQQHDVTAVALGAGGQPLFQSRLIGLGELADVKGVSRLKPGSYGFYCSIHPGMKGTLIVS
jgi:outer membrane protein assembly factor BamB/plastocyanin